MEEKKEEQSSFAETVKDYAKTFIIIFVVIFALNKLV